MIEKIASGKFEELRRRVFGQRLKDDSEGTYTIPLSEEEECALMEQVAQAVPKSKDFLLEYMQHYPLCNKAVDLLLSRFDEPNVKIILLKMFERYGYNEQQGLAVCRLVGLKDPLFMRRFCKSARIFYIDLYQSLSRLGTEEELGELYRKSADAYRSNKG